MSPIFEAGSHIAQALMTFAVLIVASAIVAFVAARAYGGTSRRKRRAIYSTVGFIGLIGAAIFTFIRLRGPI